MRRIAQCIRLDGDRVTEYRRLHEAVWPEVLATIARCGIRNYSIFLKDPENILFAVFEYHGTDYAADMAAMAADARTREWWALTQPCQIPFEHRGGEEWWAAMDEVFHAD